MIQIKAPYLVFLSITQLTQYCRLLVDLLKKKITPVSTT